MRREHAIIFDVDGVLLDLTTAEENIFFAAFADYGDPASLSRDWNSYRIRNDDNIVDEIMERLGIAASEKPEIVRSYFETLADALAAGKLASPPISGAHDLLAALKGEARLGIATANFRTAAKLRLQAAHLWKPVASLAFGADGGGPKRDILARAIAAADLPAQQIIFIGDNLNDVEAGLGNGVTFIGFSEDETKRRKLAAAGARQVCANHDETLALIRQHMKG